MTQELRDRADLIMAWEAFEPGMEAPAPLDYEDTACKLMAAAAELERLEKLATEQGLEIAITHERDERLEDEIEKLKAENVDKARAWDETAKKNAIIERLRAALKIARIMVRDEPIAYAQYSNGRTLIQILDLALSGEQNAGEREYDPNVAPCDDAEFGAKP